jgi:hypothetical protein
MWSTIEALDVPVEEARDYLLSDRGRVYTMLAHASGRLN